MSLELNIQSGVRPQLVFNGAVQVLSFPVPCEKSLFEVVIVSLGLFEACYLLLQGLYISSLFLIHGLKIDKFYLVER